MIKSNFTLRRIAASAVLVLILIGCTDTPTPKPIGYFRIDLPENNYQYKTFGCPFSFESSKYSQLAFFDKTKSPCWFNIEYPRLNATVHITYKPIENNLREYLEEARALTYEHQSVASKIDPQIINEPEKNVYGLAYELGGNVASPYQFYLTDSTDHFLRGSLYFSSKPNADSLKPAMDFIKRDLEHFAETFQWKN
jgi:gliding motility-associated lipoprotein GldD